MAALPTAMLLAAALLPPWAMLSGRRGVRTMVAVVALCAALAVGAFALDARPGDSTPTRRGPHA